MWLWLGSAGTATTICTSSTPYCLHSQAQNNNSNNGDNSRNYLCATDKVKLKNAMVKTTVIANVTMGGICSINSKMMSVAPRTTSAQVLTNENAEHNAWDTSTRVAMERQLIVMKMSTLGCSQTPISHKKLRGTASSKSLNISQVERRSF
eukprot:TRINITY_DN2938_c6_g1_i1.p1 TRINITY_DN2938_c6_g1~~TRINITY_DN2938_c6_g1_i1.p1  ORF type:complete len:150 (-),score=16.70 TRINITY_DN2938_c6_g1_i1:111-560(-)